MKSDFTTPFYEVLTVLFLVGYLFRSLSLLIHLGDILALIPSLIQLVVFFFLFTKSHHLAYTMKLWAVYLFISAGITFVSKLLLAISRNSYPEGVEWKVFIMVSGLLIYCIAARKVQLVPEDVSDAF